MKARPYTRLLATGDWHSGHQVGLSTPEYHTPTTSEKKYIKLANVRKEVWNWFDMSLKPYRPIDILLLNGDALDGKGERSGGTEQITSDRNEQCNIGYKVIEFIDPSIIRMTYGTPYHTGTGEDWEDVLAEKAGAKIGSHEWFDINGKIFDCKHKIGSSQIPHGRFTPIAREILWNREWAVDGSQPRADVLLRSHVHYFSPLEYEGTIGMTLPAMQGFGSKYGSRQCSGKVHIGFVIFDIYESGAIRWNKVIANTKTTKAQAEKL
jgi:hypothetical protein